nr:FecR domain-containing protein [uncultured Sphingomonas sp.]
MSAELPSLAMLKTLGPERAAAIWLERLLRIESGDADAASGDTLFEEWLHDDANRVAWDRAIELWDGLAEVDGSAFENMRSEALRIRPHRRVRSWRSYAIAASILAVVLVSLFANYGKLTRPAPEARIAATPPAEKQYRTQVGQRATVVLADGSKVTLDTDSVLRAAITSGVRTARLVQGQALFEVRHDARRPFRVAAGDRVVAVLGTEFDIRVSADETRIMLVRGSIAVTEGSDPFRVDETGAQRLAAGDQLVVRKGMPDVKSRFVADARLQWRHGFLQFDNERLGAAVIELNRYSPRKIVLRDPRVANLRISGAFPTGNRQAFLTTATALYPLRVIPLPDGSVELTSKP